MSVLIDEAVEVLRRLPEDLQNAIARSILFCSDETETVLPLSTGWLGVCPMNIIM